MATPNTRKRKRQTITLEETQSILEASKTKLKVSRFNHALRQQISVYIKTMEQYCKKHTKKSKIWKISGQPIISIDTILKSKDKIQKTVDEV
jgi:hypothetical protein